MENKVLITLYVPSLGKNYDIYLPVNKKIHVIIKLIIKMLIELTGGTFIPNDDFLLYSSETGNVYDVNQLLRYTDIRNNSKIILA